MHTKTHTQTHTSPIHTCAVVTRAVRGMHTLEEANLGPGTHHKEHGGPFEHVGEGQVGEVAVGGGCGGGE